MRMIFSSLAVFVKVAYEFLIKKFVYMDQLAFFLGIWCDVHIMNHEGGKEQLEKLESQIDGQTNF